MSRATSSVSMIVPSTNRPHEHDWNLLSTKRKRTDDQDEYHFDPDFHEPPTTKLQGPHAEKHSLDSVQDGGGRPSNATTLAAQAVKPFYAKHIPTQYNPQGDGSTRLASAPKPQNTKFCYRHRPDMLCRRQADEPSMDELQQGLEALPEGDKQAIVSVWSLFSAAPAKQRSLMLQGILTQCCFPQLSLLAHNVRELIRIDFLSALPSEISFKILCFLDTTSLCKAAQVSRKWRQLADDDVVWHRMCEQHIDRKCTKCGWGLPLLDRKRLRASKRQMQLRAAGRAAQDEISAVSSVAQTEDSSSLARPRAVSNDASPVPVETEKSCSSPAEREHCPKTRPWKDVYRDRFKVGSNWKHGRYTERVLKGHGNGIMAMQMLDNILATGSYDNTIKIWDLDTGCEIRTLRGHTTGVRCLQLDDSKLISGGMDKTIKIWNWRTGECVRTIYAHRDSVIGLHFENQFLVTGSADRTAKVFTFGADHGSSVTLRGHDEWVNSVKIDTVSRTVFTASDDFTIKMWDLDTQRCLRTYKGHTAHVQQVQLLPHEFDLEDDGLESALDAASPPSTPQSDCSEPLVSVNLRDPSPVLTHSTLNTHSESDPFNTTFEGDRPKPPRYMVTSGLDAQIRIWEIHTGRCVRTLFGHIEGVWALAADMLRIVSGAEDRVVKIWDPRTGKCEGNFTGHSGPVTCLALSDSRICSGGEDGEVRVYCFNS